MRGIALLLTAAIGTVALLAFFYPSIMVNAADEAAKPVEGEDFDVKPTGTKVVTDSALYSPPNGQALKFVNNTAIAREKVNFVNEADVVLWARGGQSGSSPTLRVKVDSGEFSPAQAIINEGAPVAYTYDLNIPTGVHTIKVNAGNTGRGRYPFLDYVTFPANGSGGDPDTTPPDTNITSGPSGNLTGTTATFEFDSTETGSTFLCRLLPLESSHSPCNSPTTYPNLTVGTEYTFSVWAKDTAGNIDTSPATSTFTPIDGGSDPDTDGDGVPDSTDQCDTQAGPPPTGCPSDGDSDGIPDTSDDCPNDRGPVSTNGCPIEGGDADLDGVPDSTKDQCDTERGPVSTNGCPIPSGTEVIVGAGDISSQGTRDNQTGALVQQELDNGAFSAFTTGDNAYPDGTYNNYLVYDAAWGAFKGDTRPAYGNHDYFASNEALGSEQYWKEPPDPTPVYVSNGTSFYAYNVGNSNWRAIVLNSVSTEGPTSNHAPLCNDDPALMNDQMDFLNGELVAASNTNKNTVLFWHHARFSVSDDHPTSEGETGCSRTFFDVAHDYGADLVVQGHSHMYERYNTRDKTTGLNVTGGLTSIVCGTGGKSFDTLLPPDQWNPSPDVAFTNAWGVCELTLNPNNAQVDFLPAPGSPGSDSATVAVRP
jgi:hypothetical protein